VRYLFVYVCVCVLLLLPGVVLAGVYQNSEVTSDTGEPLRVKDSVHRILASPAWAQFTATLSDLWHGLWHGGWSGFSQQLNGALDADGSWRAREDLQVGEAATLPELKAAHKRLIFLYHPDKSARTVGMSALNKKTHFFLWLQVQARRSCRMRHQVPGLVPQRSVHQEPMCVCVFCRRPCNLLLRFSAQNSLAKSTPGGPPRKMMTTTRMQNCRRRPHPNRQRARRPSDKRQPEPLL
jgi:hypothetical protein